MSSAAVSPTASGYVIVLSDALPTRDGTKLDRKACAGDLDSISRRLCVTAGVPTAAWADGRARTFGAPIVARTNAPISKVAGLRIPPFFDGLVRGSMGRTAHRRRRSSELRAFARGRERRDSPRRPVADFAALVWPGANGCVDGLVGSRLDATWTRTGRSISF